MVGQPQQLMGLTGRSGQYLTHQSIFPPQNLPFNILALKLNEEKYVRKRYVFQGSKISALQTKAASESVRHPTRVEAVTAFIWKCATKASRSNSKQLRSSVIAQCVNLRKRMMPPLPGNAMGNLICFSVSQAATESEIDLASLVVQMRKTMHNFDDDYVKRLRDNPSIVITEALKQLGKLLLQEGNTDLYLFSSLCRFPFYGMDFGWGKPTWVTCPRDVFKNIIDLIDSRDGDGIEAWVTLTEKDMACLELDQELLEFASLNPSVIPICSL